MGRFIKTFAAATLVLAGLAAPSFAQGPARSPLAMAERGTSTERSPLGTTGKYQEDRKVLEDAFPNLKKVKFEVMAPATPDYNCLAWALGTTSEWVWPGDNIDDFDKFIGAFSKKLSVDGKTKWTKFQRLDTLDYSVQDGKEKIVLYGMKKDGRYMATHIARQMPDGTWTSKPGACALIKHASPEDLDGETYGSPLAVYERETK